MNGERFRGRFYNVRTIEVKLASLSPDSANSCPVPWEHIIEHVVTETDDGKPMEGLEPTFLRTAKIGATDYWIWRFCDKDQDPNYIVVGRWSDGEAVIECDSTFDMTPEQYLVASYFQIEP